MIIKFNARYKQLQRHRNRINATNKIAGQPERNDTWGESGQVLELYSGAKSRASPEQGNRRCILCHQGCMSLCSCLGQIEKVGWDQGPSRFERWKSGATILCRLSVVVLLACAAGLTLLPCACAFDVVLL